MLYSTKKKIAVSSGSDCVTASARCQPCVVLDVVNEIEEVNF